MTLAVALSSKTGFIIASDLKICPTRRPLTTAWGPRLRSSDFEATRFFVGLSQSWRDALDEDEMCALHISGSFWLFLGCKEVTVTTRIREWEFESLMDLASVKHACAEFIGHGCGLAMALGLGAGSVQVAGASQAFLGEIGSRMIGAEDAKLADQIAGRLVMRILKGQLERSPHSHEPGLPSAYDRSVLWARARAVAPSRKWQAGGFVQAPSERQSAGRSETKRCGLGGQALAGSPAQPRYRALLCSDCRTPAWQGRSWLALPT